MFKSLENDPALARRLTRAAARALPHAVILSGGSAERRRSLALELAAAMQCTGAEPPCGDCLPCSKTLRGIHPDVSFIESEKQSIPVELIRDMRADAHIRPNEGRRKLYIIPEAEKLGEAASNAMLKVIEEPPEGAAFMLLCPSADLLLSTVRSRCVEFSLLPEDGGADEGGLCGELVSALCSGSTPELVDFFASLERDKKKREALPELPGAMRARLIRALADPSDRLSVSLGRRRVAELCGMMEQAGRWLDGNVGQAHIIGYLLAGFTEEPQARRI